MGNGFSITTYKHLYTECYLLQYKQTLLHLASMNDEADVVNILISHGGYVHAVDMVNKYVL